MNLVPEQWREPFPEQEIPYILAAILRCCELLKKESFNEHENCLTIRLVRLLRRDHMMLKRPVHLDWEVSEFDSTNPEQLGRLDLRFLFSTGILHPWPCFAVEAKRLHVTFPKGGWKSLVSEYATTATQRPVEEEQGMMCFISGRYSKGLRAGAMVGYVYDGRIDDARRAIAEAIVEQAEKLKVKKPSTQNAHRIFQGTATIRESVHELSDGPFTVYHVLTAV
jgi:hypothetical protein